jgi:peroxiredoxin
MIWSEARSAALIARREYQLSCRGPAFWVVAAAGSVLALWRSSSSGVTAALAAYATWNVTVLALSVLAILIAASAAARDRREAASELVFSKALGNSPYLVAARFLGVWGSLITIVVIMLAVAAARQVIGGSPWHLGAYSNALVRCLAPLALATALGFSLTTLFVSPLAAGIAALYWVSVPLARGQLPWVADMTPTQHWPVAALLAAGLVSLTAALYGRALQTGGSRAPLGWAAALLFAGAGLAALGIAFSGDDTLTRRDPILSAMAAQRVLDKQPAPGFWSPDGSGRLVGLSDLSDRPIALAFWGPSAPESAQVLRLLQDAARKFRSANLACIAVCVDSDSGAAAPFADEVKPEVTVIWDRGQHYGDGERWSDSPLGLAYEVKQVPAIFLLDRHRRLQARLDYEALPRLEAALTQVVAEP